jgi:hypothetical protein
VNSCDAEDRDCNATAAVDSADGQGVLRSADHYHHDVVPELDVREQYVPACSGVVGGIDGGGQSGPWELLPPQFKMKRYCFKRSEPTAGAKDIQRQALSGGWVRIEWPSALELAADELLEHFGAFGSISDLEWLDNSDDSCTEVIKLYFDLRTCISEILRTHRHSVRRKTDGKLIGVKAYMKFSDNAARKQLNKK